MQIIGVCGRKGSGKDTVGDVLTQQCGFQRVALADPIKQLAYQIFDLGEETLFGPSAARERKISQATARAWWSRALAWVDKEEVQATIARLFREPKIATENLRTLIWRTLEPYGGLLTARVVLQQMGTEWGRATDENVWVREVLRVADALAAGHAYRPLLGVLPHRSGSAQRTEASTPGVVITDVRFHNEVRSIQRHHNYSGKVWTVNAQQRLPPQDLGEHASEPPYEDTARWSDTIIDNNGSKDDLPPVVIREALALQLQQRA